MFMATQGTWNAENLMWGSDYPHAEGTFPQSMQVINRVMQEVSPDDRAKMLYMNTQKVFSFN